MSASDLPTKTQLTKSCNAAENLLDSLNSHTNITLINRSRIVPLVKALFTSLQRLEDDESDPDGAFHTAATRARLNLAVNLRYCDVVADRVQERIDSNTLRRDDDLGLELLAVNAEIERFLKLRKRKATATAQGKQGSTSDSSAIVEDLLRKQENHESVVEALEAELRTLYARESTFEQESLAMNQEIGELKNRNEAKLSHIRRLHAAIANLGLRHPMPYTTQDWEELSVELPAMVQRIEKINFTLKELELERDKRYDQECDSEEDSIHGQVPTVPKAPSAGTGPKSATKEKDREKDKDGDKKKKEQRRSVDAKATSKIRSPSPTSSETSKANTSKSVRRKSRHHHPGSGFFFGT
ncbi:hypothetical protein EPUS_02937 [Endocarpon pusillum Z07020]|uniref:Uncharacterized protein n=1 Tax=Endocarpon pusillum (strain Z07020 / HMAS-L-300199) TaxID=1263415 RepID=U1GJZ6_ENDPU|nr:uncharacterized protein EPUS_02937 [Endocarpon pusillum Z07020]ERF72146.1 hypothetical protein EPUS_02937 [Endocarpon pusillum Z07020]